MIEVAKIEGFDEITKKLANLPNVTSKATVSAMNKTIRKGRTQASKAIRTEYNIKAKDLKGTLIVTHAKWSKYEKERRYIATLTGEGKPLPLYKFGVRPSEPQSQKGIPVKARKPYTVKIKKKGGRTVLKHGFVAKLRSGWAPNLYTRTGKFHTRETKATAKEVKRETLRTMYSLGVSQMFKQKGLTAVRELVKKEGISILRHEVDFYLKKESGLLPAKKK